MRWRQHHIILVHEKKRGCQAPRPKFLWHAFQIIVAEFYSRGPYPGPRYHKNSQGVNMRVRAFAFGAIVATATTLALTGTASAAAPSMTARVASTVPSDNGVHYCW